MRLFSFLIAIFFLGLTLFADAQNLTQTIRGAVQDQDSKIPVIGANITILNTDPFLGASTDLEGNFKIQQVPVGRYDINR